MKTCTKCSGLFDESVLAEKSRTLNASGDTQHDKTCPQCGTLLCRRMVVDGEESVLDVSPKAEGPDPLDKRKHRAPPPSPKKPTTRKKSAKRKKRAPGKKTT